MTSNDLPALTTAPDDRGAGSERQWQGGHFGRPASPPEGVYSAVYRLGHFAFEVVNLDDLENEVVYSLTREYDDLDDLDDLYLWYARSGGFRL